MTSMMSPPVASHFMPTTLPRSGILLNASPASSAPNSPKRTSYLGPFSSTPVALTTHQISHSSHSSASSSTCSTDDIVSSTSATSTGGTQASASPATAHQAPRKIRFAPLPEPRRDYDYEYDDDDMLSPGCYNETDSVSSSPNTAASALLPPPLLPNVIPPTPTRPTLSGESHGEPSCSTLGLSLDGSEPPDSGPATETNTVTGSECGTDDTHTASSSKKKLKWSSLLRLPKAAPLIPGVQTPDEHSGQFNLWRSSSRESFASACSSRGSFFGVFGSLSEPNNSTASLSSPVSRRRMTTGADSVPTSPAYRGGLSLKLFSSEAGTAPATGPRVAKRGSMPNSSASTARRGTRLLNGRVYGRRPHSAGGNPNKNPFATVLDQEPEFVEWGHGGMGSVRGGAGTGSSQWSRLQTDKKLSVGHDDGDGTSGGAVADDDDGGSGMGWVRRRKEAREKKEREEREAKEKAEKEAALGDEGKPELAGMKVAVAEEPEPSEEEVTGPVTPGDASEEVDGRLPRISEKEERVEEGDKEENEETEKEKKAREYVYTAVTVPAMHHRRSHSRQNSASRPSSLTTSRQNSMSNPILPSLSPGHSDLGTPTTETTPHASGSTTPFGVFDATVGVGPSPLATTQCESPPSSSETSSMYDECPPGDKEDGSEEEEEEEDDHARKTAIGAGVEKVSRHKD